jgi:16S rRNA (guanine527-N7)-methyltransferase
MLYKEYGVPHGTIEKYIKLLLMWNKKTNLVSVGNEKELIERHILDSLQLKEFVEDDKVVFDVGSGAGFPGLMLSYAGAKKVNLVEINRKKASFLVTAAALSEQEIKVHDYSIYEMEAKICDIVTARGFASLEKIFELTYHLIHPKTKYILLKGKNIEYEIKNALEKWKFKYIIHQSKTSEEGCILEVEQLERHEQKDYCSSKSEGRSR